MSNLFRIVPLAISLALLAAACKKQAESGEVVLKGTPGCHGGGCPDASKPCKECGADEWCWCSECCVALKDRKPDWEERTKAAKEQARALAKKQGLRTDRTP